VIEASDIRMQARLQLALYLPGWYSLWVDAVHTANTKKCEEEIMMLAKEFTFEVEGGLKIFVRKLLPEAGRHFKGIVLIAHGGAEHSARYVRFGKVLNENGFVVYAHDQRGHGQTAANPAIIHINEGGLNAAVESLIKDGFAKTTTQAVVKRAGATRGTLLHHFPNREDMLVAAVEFVLDQNVQTGCREKGVNYVKSYR